MKKNLLSTISVLLLLFSLLSVLCACGNDPGKENESETQPSISGTPGKYGRIMTVDGIPEYVDSDGVATLSVKEDAVTVLKAEYTDRQGKTGYYSIGLDCRNADLPDECVLRAQVITRMAEPRAYDELYGKIDEKIKDEGIPAEHEFLRIWIEDVNGTVLQYNGIAACYVMTGDGRNVCNVYGLDDAEDEKISYTINTAPVPGTPFEGKYAVLSLTHYSIAYAIFYEN